MTKKWIESFKKAKHWIQKFFKTPKLTTNKKYVASKSKGFSDESIKSSATADNNLNAILNYFNNYKFRVEFNGRWWYWWGWRWWLIVFMVWLTNEKHLALFPAGTIANHHRKSPTRRKQDFNLRRTWVQVLLNEVIYHGIIR